MAATNTQTSTNIHTVSIEFANDETERPIQVVDDDMHFGILNITSKPNIPVTKRHLHIEFTIDCSASMGDQCADGRTKMQHIIFTLENILRFIHDSENKQISIHVQAFDNNCHDIISNVDQISEQNIEELIAKIKLIRPQGSTNIEGALRTSLNSITQYRTSRPNTNTSMHSVIQLFLTDGEITSGCTSVETLQSLLCTETTNIFIGYGIDHDSVLLNKLASVEHNDYEFIDSIENAGLVYGEILNDALTKALEHVTITCDNCEIYDYRTKKCISIFQTDNIMS